MPTVGGRFRLGIPGAAARPAHPYPGGAVPWGTA